MSNTNKIKKILKYLVLIFLFYFSPYYLANAITEIFIPKVSYPSEPNSISINLEAILEYFPIWFYITLIFLMVYALCYYVYELLKYAVLVLPFLSGYWFYAAMSEGLHLGAEASMGFYWVTLPAFSASVCYSLGIFIYFTWVRKWLELKEPPDENT